jgi:thioredoxin-like negative regulator of GroEL
VVALFWADWSRPALELLPTAAELAAEYEGEGVIFYTVSLGRPEHKDARRVLARFPMGSRHFILDEDPGLALMRFGLADVPAVLVYAPGGQLKESMGAGEETPLTPADLADAVESVAGELERAP